MKKVTLQDGTEIEIFEQEDIDKVVSEKTKEFV